MGLAAFWACRETFLFGLFILFQESVDKLENLLLLESGQIPQFDGIFFFLLSCIHDDNIGQIKELPQKLNDLRL